VDGNCSRWCPVEEFVLSDVEYSDVTTESTSVRTQPLNEYLDFAP